MGHSNIRMMKFKAIESFQQTNNRETWIWSSPWSHLKYVYIYNNKNVRFANVLIRQNLAAHGVAKPIALQSKLYLRHDQSLSQIADMVFSMFRIYIFIYIYIYITISIYIYVYRCMSMWTGIYNTDLYHLWSIYIYDMLKHIYILPVYIQI